MSPSRAAHNKRPGRSSSQLCRPTTRARIYARDGWRCVWCDRGAAGSDTLTLDHLHPRSLGGSNRYWNLVTSCRSCNSRRRNRPAIEFARAFGFEAPAIALRVLAAVSLPLPALPKAA